MGYIIFLQLLYEGIDTDTTFESVFPGGMGSTVAFGKLAAMVQCAALAPFNWSMVAANVLSVGRRRAEHGRDLRLPRESRFQSLRGRQVLPGTCGDRAVCRNRESIQYEYITFLLAVCGLLLAISGLNIVTARALTPADDGTHPTVITALRLAKQLPWSSRYDQTAIVHGGAAGTASGLWPSQHFAGHLGGPCGVTPAGTSSGAGCRVYNSGAFSRLYRTRKFLVKYGELYYELWRCFQRAAATYPLS
jgi:hypothetical protein